MGWVRAHFSERRLVYGRTEGRLACSTCHYFWKVRFSTPVAFVRTSSLPPPPPQKLPKTGYQEQENEVNCYFQFPTPLIWCHISHPSINSQPSCVGVCDSMTTLYLLPEDTEIVPTSVKVFTVVVIVLIRYNVVWTSRWRNIYFVFSGQGSMEKLVQCVSGDMMSVKGTVVRL